MRKRKSTASEIKKQSNYVDKIIKENCEGLLPSIFRRILQLDFYKMENVPAIKQQATLEKEPDFLRKIYNDEFPKGAITQLEFESGEDLDMDKRMLLYLAMEYRRTGLPIIQYVIYLGKGKSKIKCKVKFSQIDYAYYVINIEDFSYREFINSTIPEEVILSMLANHEDLSLERLLELIVGQIYELKGDSLATKKFVNQLVMLSRFRNLHSQTVKKLKVMGFIGFDINTDILYQDGKAEGLEQGLEQGLEIGELKKTIFAIQTMTKEKVEKKLIARFLNVELTFVNQIQKQLLKKEKIIGLLRLKNANEKKIAEQLKVHPLLVNVLADELKKSKKK